MNVMYWVLSPATATDSLCSEASGSAFTDARRSLPWVLSVRLWLSSVAVTSLPCSGAPVACRRRSRVGGTFWAPVRRPTPPAVITTYE